MHAMQTPLGITNYNSKTAEVLAETVGSRLKWLGGQRLRSEGMGRTSASAMLALA